MFPFHEMNFITHTKNCSVLVVDEKQIEGWAKSISSKFLLHISIEMKAILLGAYISLNFVRANFLTDQHI